MDPRKKRKKKKRKGKIFLHTGAARVHSLNALLTRVAKFFRSVELMDEAGLSGGPARIS
jgi:hypothetical protein